MLTKVRNWMKRQAKKFFYLVFPRLAVFFIRVVLWTCRVEIVGLAAYKKLASTEKCILILWHNRLALAPEFFGNKVSEIQHAPAVSNSRDGELLTSVIGVFQNGKVVRVPHRGRSQALREMLRVLQQKIVVIITPDGPRGPRYEVKPGVAFLAIETAAKIVPFSWTASRFWQLGTWDQLRLPRPFSKVVVGVGAPIAIESVGVTEACALLKEGLLSFDRMLQERTN